MSLVLDINFFLPALLGAFLGGVIIWGTCTRSAKRATALQTAMLNAKSNTELQSLNQLHATQKTALEQRNNELTIRFDLMMGQLNESKAHRDQLQQQHAAKLQAVELRHAEQLQKVESPLTVVVHPFVNTEVDEGFIKSTTSVEVGYKYQLMIQGIPCMEPHDVVVERQTKVKVDEQAIKAWGEKALALAEAAIQIKGGAAASSLISVAKTVIQGRK